MQFSHLQNKAHIQVSFPFLLGLQMRQRPNALSTPLTKLTFSDLLLHSTRHVLSGLYLNMKQKLLLLISGYYGCTYSCIMLLNSWRRHHMTLNLVIKPRQWIFQFTVQVIIHKMQNIRGSCHAGFLLFETCKRWNSRLENEATRMYQHETYLLSCTLLCIHQGRKTTSTRWPIPSHHRPVTALQWGQVYLPNTKRKHAVMTGDWRL